MFESSDRVTSCAETPSSDRFFKRQHGCILYCLWYPTILHCVKLQYINNYITFTVISQQDFSCIKLHSQKYLVNKQHHTVFLQCMCTIKVPSMQCMNRSVCVNVHFWHLVSTFDVIYVYMCTLPAHLHNFY